MTTKRELMVSFSNPKDGGYYNNDTNEPSIVARNLNRLEKTTAQDLTGSSATEILAITEDPIEDVLEAIAKSLAHDAKNEPGSAQVMEISDNLFAPKKHSQNRAYAWIWSAAKQAWTTA